MSQNENDLNSFLLVGAHLMRLDEYAIEVVAVATKRVVISYPHSGCCGIKPHTVIYRSYGEAVKNAGYLQAVLRGKST